MIQAASFSKRNNYPDINNGGFTLVELLVAVALFSITVGVGAARYADFNRSQTIKAAGETFKNNLRDIQTKAFTNVIPATTTCIANPFQGYQVQFFNTTTPGSPCAGKACFQAYPRCNDSNEGTPSIYTLPDQVDFNSLPGNVDFKTLGMGTSVGNFVVTLRAYSSLPAAQQYFYKVCISISGELKDCKFKKGDSSFACSC